MATRTTEPRQDPRGANPAIDFAAARDAMIESQLMPCGIVSPAVVEAFRAVPREAFVAPGRAEVAYVDAEQPLAPGRTMPAPLTLGRLLERAAIRRGERVLVVGAGSGYAAAVVARLGAEVTALESDPSLAARARHLLGEAPGTRVVEGPLAGGAGDFAPHDVILFDGAIEVLPPALAAQLAPGGRVLAVRRGADGVARAAAGVRSGDGIAFDSFAEAPAPLLAEFRQPPSFRF